MEINFIDSLSTTSIEKRYILNLEYYISRFYISFACEFYNISDIIRYLNIFFIIYRKFYVFYINLDYYFDKKLRDFLSDQEIEINYSSSAIYKSIDLIEVIN